MTASSAGPFALAAGDLQRLVYALLREEGTGITVSRRGTFIDFDVAVPGRLDTRLIQRFRLYLTAPSRKHLEELRAEADASGLQPVAIVPQGTTQSPDALGGLPVISAKDLERLCKKSGLVKTDSDAFIVDREALHELQDSRDPRIALLNGLIWLRQLSRDRMPPALQWTGTPPHELFERCFFLSMTSTFGCTGVTWGTKSRGKVIPDGRLTFRGLAATVLYDCKAARKEYEMEYRDLTGFVDYLNHPLEQAWARPTRGALYFLIVSSDFSQSTAAASFEARRKALATKTLGAQLVWLRAPDLARFGLAIERAEVSHADRGAIRWRQLLSSGNVTWSNFEAELDRLAAKGYSFN
jgi:hypothetical protein